mmetsp:Transcript_120544/g.257407  ORF Transcript_120544/g.257407 Transcript_120544/m.257407 type:complete len:221 (+) Transcript_120544:818-1480(+)
MRRRPYRGRRPASTSISSPVTSTASRSCRPSCRRLSVGSLRRSRISRSWRQNSERQRKPKLKSLAGARRPTCPLQRSLSWLANRSRRRSSKLMSRRGSPRLPLQVQRLERRCWSSAARKAGRNLSRRRVRKVRKRVGWKAIQTMRAHRRRKRSWSGPQRRRFLSRGHRPRRRLPGGSGSDGSGKPLPVNLRTTSQRPWSRSAMSMPSWRGTSSGKCLVGT